MKALTHLLLSLFLFFSLAACNSDDSETESSGVSPELNPGVSIKLSSNYDSIPTGTGASVLITAQALDSDGIPLADTSIAFQANSGTLSTTNTLTDINGAASTSLTSAERSNRTITVTAGIEDSTASIGIELFGSTLAIEGPHNLVSGDPNTLSFTLKDYTNAPVVTEAISINSFNSISPATLITNADGKASATLTATQAETLSASALGIIATHEVSFPNEVFELVLAPEIAISNCQPIELQWAIAGMPQADQSISFTSTRGTLYSDAACTTVGDTLTTGASGRGTIYLQSITPGPATLTADASAAGGPQTSKGTEFVATIPASITLQADNTSILPNSSATLTAAVRDASGNLVKNAVVQFSIEADATGGSLSTRYAKTDSLGRAQTVFSATEQTSADNGIIIQATVDGTTIVDTIDLTVGASALFVTIALPNVVGSPTPASYEIQGDVLVTDAAGFAVANQDVNLKIIPTHYDKGMRVPDLSDYWLAYSNVLVTGTPVQKDLACLSEDFLTGDPLKDGNGTIDAGEDLNGNGSLEPGGVVALSDSIVTTGSDGRATLTFAYPKDNASWTQVKLTATTTNATGNESADTEEFLLPVAASDITGSGIVGATSPYGTGSSCADPN